MNNTGKKFGGRQKGTPNKITSEIRDKISVIINGTLESLDLTQMTRREKILLLQVLCQYAIPRQKHFVLENKEHTINISNQ
jgi:predicted Mrr-cat superfamily restriction endonuclease